MNTIEKSNSSIDRKEFLTQVGISFGAILLMNCVSGCGTAEIPDPQPPAPTSKLDITINTNDAAYSNLKTKGGFAVIKASNIIVARTQDDNWIAVSSQCTHQQVEIAYRSASNDFRCPLHGSEFTSNGAVQKGPAASALNKFNTTFTANSGILRIFE